MKGRGGKDLFIILGAVEERVLYPYCPERGTRGEIPPLIILANWKSRGGGEEVESGLFSIPSM